MNTINTFNFSLPENSAQFSDIASKGSELIAIIGFDFGTSSSKIIIQLPFVTGEPKFAVPFSNFASPSLQYLLPTHVFVDKNGVCSLKEGNSKEYIEIATIKDGLMGDPKSFVNSVNGSDTTFSAEQVAVAYIALAIRYTRCWFISNNTQYKENKLKWSLNLGLPAAKDDQEEPRNSFEMVGKAAWIASLKSGPITIDSSEKALNEVRTEWNSDAFMIDFKVLAEVIAEVHGYSHSDFQNAGLHILIDAGATTLDINAFMIRQAGVQVGKNYTLIAVDVKNFGSIILHRDRIKKAKSVCDDKELQLHLENLNIHDSTQIVPELIEEYIPDNLSEENSSKVLSALEYEDNNFRKKKAFYNYLSIMLNLLRERKNPYSIKLSKALEELPIILCGGASAMSIYKDLVDIEMNEWLGTFENEGFTVRSIKLPKPESLEADIADDEMHRLAVAYGLSFPEYKIGDYFRPSEVDLDREPSYRNIEGDFVDSSQV